MFSQAQFGFAAASAPPVIYFLQPVQFPAGGVTQTTVLGQNLPTNFGYYIVDAFDHPVLGTGSTYPLGTPNHITYGQYVASNAPHGFFRLRVQNSGGVAYHPIQIV